jgi:hypothetical protein
MSDPTPVPEPAGAAAVVNLSTLLDQLTGAAPIEPPPTGAAPPPVPAEPAPAGAAAEAKPPEPMFRDLDSFMCNYLAPVVERRVAQGSAAGPQWCSQWWRHPEAISRLYALWRSWETLRVSDPDTGMSIWWRDHFDNHFAVLSGEYGPFAKCSPDRGHVATTALPIEPAPKDVLAQLPDYELRPS